MRKKFRVLSKQRKAALRRRLSHWINRAVARCYEAHRRDDVVRRSMYGREAKGWAEIAKFLEPVHVTAYRKPDGGMAFLGPGEEP